MNTTAKTKIAIGLTALYGIGTVRVGDSSQRQADSDVDIVGAPLGASPIDFTSSLTIVSGITAVPFSADGTAREVVFLDADGTLIDRFIIPDTVVRAGGSLNFVWSLEVL